MPLEAQQPGVKVCPPQAVMLHCDVRLTFKALFVLMAVKGGQNCCNVGARVGSDVGLVLIVGCGVGLPGR